MRRWLAVVAAGGAIAFAVGFPHPEERWLHAFWCLRCSQWGGVVDVLLNVALFVPLGLALRQARVGPVAAILAMIAYTFAIECLQYFVIVGRTGSFRDVLTNGVGGALGYALFPAAAGLGRPSTRTAGVLAWSLAAGWTGHAVLTTVAFRPERSPHLHFGQWAPHLGGFDRFRGTLLNATFDGITVADGPFPPALMELARRTDSLVLAAAATPGPEPAAIAPIVSIADSHGSEIALLGQQGQDLVFRARVRAHSMGLIPPAVTVHGAFDPRTSGARSVSGTQRGLVLDARSIDSEGHRREATLALSPSVGWMLWWTFFVPGGMTMAVMTGLWLAVPAALLGYWGARSTDERSGLRLSRALGPAAVAIVTAHFIVPAIAGAPMPAAVEIVALVAGAAAGIAASAYGTRGRMDGRLV